MWRYGYVDVKRHEKKIESGRHMNIDIPSVYIFPNVIIAFIVGNYIIKRPLRLWKKCSSKGGQQN